MASEKIEKIEERKGALEKAEKSDGTSKVPVEKERVPKMTKHFESLAERAKGTAALGTRDEHETHSKTGTDPRVQANKETQPLSLEEIGKYRAEAQQKSIEAIMLPNATHHASEEAIAKDQQDYEYATEKGQKGVSAAKDTIAGAGKTALNYTVLATEKTKYAVVKGSEAALHYAEEKTVGAKDTAVSMAKRTASYAGEKTAGAKDAALNVGKSTANYAGEKIAGMKDTAVNVAKSTASYAGEKAVAAKDATLEGTKQLASSTAQKATMVGLGVAHYTAEKAVEAAEAAAAAGHKVAELSAEKMDSANKTPEAPQEPAEFTEEMQRDAEMSWKAEEETMRPREERGHLGAFSELLGAVGETVAEIAQHAKEMVVGEQTPRKG